MAPLSFFEEENTQTNLPVQIDLYSIPGQSYEFLFIAKGGGSANSSYLFQKTKALLNPQSFKTFVIETLSSLGTSACPPYHLSLVVGGTSAEENLKIVKLASCGELDHLPSSGTSFGRAFRDHEMEALVEQWAKETRIGAQFGGKYFLHSARVIRLPRHGASCPIGIGVSCSADRQIKAKIDPSGVYLEQLVSNPAQYLIPYSQAPRHSISINLKQPIKTILKDLSSLSVSDRVFLSGPMIVARDIAHAKIKEKLDQTGQLPEYMLNHPIYYAGPAKTPPGYPSGSFGPTTSKRMDSYVPDFQKQGGSLIMLGKGNRSDQVLESCHHYGGFYLGSIGGSAARLGKECITKIEAIDFFELGMEAVWKIEVKNFPVFVIIDNKGNNFFNKL